jgi:hypothetical protein
VRREGKEASRESRRRDEEEEEEEARDDFVDDDEALGAGGAGRAATGPADDSARSASCTAASGDAMLDYDARARVFFTF